jgi:hypothetical protein
MLQYGIRAPVFNTEPGWVEQVEIEAKFHREKGQAFEILSKILHWREAQGVRQGYESFEWTNIEEG